MPRRIKRGQTFIINGITYQVSHPYWQDPDCWVVSCRCGYLRHEVWDTSAILTAVAASEVYLASVPAYPLMGGLV